MRLLVLLLLDVLSGCVLCDSVFRFGAVLSTVGSTRSISDAKKGYELFFDAVNALGDGRGFFVQGKPGTKGFYFKFAFLWREDFSDRRNHADEISKLLKQDRIHFLGGSHPKYALQEMKLANESSILCYHCCVSPDTIYERDFRTAFGITATNKDFTKLLIRKLAFEEVYSLAIVYDEDDEFTRTTCEAAIAFARDSQIGDHGDQLLIAPFNGSEASPQLIAEFAHRVKTLGIEAVIGCVYPEKGRQLVNAFDAALYSLKSFFLTVGPSKQWWVNSFRDGELVNGLLSATQWHENMNYTDDFFGSTGEYAKMYKKKFDNEAPDQDAAGASAVGATLTNAITTAFVNCDISQTKGDVDALLYDSEAIVCDDGLEMSGYDRILRTLARLDVETFYGRVQFNYFRRNVALDPVTTQVVEQETDGKKDRKIEGVLPLVYATKLIKFPAENRFRDTCSAGQHMGSGSFDPCKPCARGTFSEKANAKHCNNCPVSYWTNEPGQSVCTECPVGTSTNSTGATKITDCTCRAGFFNRAGQQGVPCEPCPEGSTCDGGVHPPIPSSGYWSNVSSKGEVYQCDPESVCLGGPKSECAEGYTGRLCAECMDGYFSIIQKCYKCFRDSVIVIVSIFLLSSWYVINVTISQSVASLEMIVDWAQLANIIGDVSLNWTPRLVTMFGVANILDFDVDILEPSCLFSWSFRHNFILQLCLPFLLTSMASSGYLSSALLYIAIDRKWIKLESHAGQLLSLFIEIPADRATLNKKWDTTIATFLASVDTSYVTIAKYCLDCFKCKTVSGISVLDASPDLECGTSEHIQLVVLAAIGLFFYVFGYLAFTVWKLYDLHDRRAFSDEINIRRFGFLYRQYELAYYYTPAFSLVRKLLFVVVLVCMNNPAFQIGTLAIVINCSLMIHVYTAPYVETYLDVLFSFLLTALMFEAFGGLMFYSENLPQDDRIVLEWIVMATLFLLICVFLIIFSKEMLAKYQTYFLKNVYRHFAWKEYGYSSGGVLSRLWLLGHQGLTPPLRKATSATSTASSRRDGEDICFELFHTFDPSFVYKALRERPDFIQEWHKLTNMLKDFMSDQAETSFLSMELTAHFWRRLVDRFPELIDLLAVADEITRLHFSDFATSLYRDFYLSKKLSPMPLMKILNWKDYAPMAQWLAIASEEDRRFFINCVSRMFRIAGDRETADRLESNLKNGVQSQKLTPHMKEKKVSKRQQWILHNFKDGSNPFHHSASSQDASIAELNLTASRKDCPQTRSPDEAPFEDVSPIRDATTLDAFPLECSEPSLPVVPSLDEGKSEESV